MPPFLRLPAAIISILSLALFMYPTALWSDYESAAVTPVKKTTTTSNGQKISYPKTDSPELTVVTVEIPAYGKTGWHRHPVPVYAYVLAGELTVEYEDGKKILFKEGDAIIEAVNTAHNGRNMSNVAVKLVVFYTGIEGHPNTVKVGDSTP